MKICIDVKCIFSVELGDIEVPDNIAEKILSFNDCQPIDNDSELGDWLNNHIRLNDAYEWEYDINNAYEEESEK